MKFRSPVNVYKFLNFFINYKVKFVSLKCSVARDDLIISFMYWNVGFICTSVVMIKTTA